MMKIKNGDLIKLKVEILAEDDTNFMELSTLVDKPNFLRLLPLIRKEYGIEELRDENSDLVTEDWSKHIINFNKYKNAKQLIDFTQKHLYVFDKEDGMDAYPAFDTEMLLWCYIFKRPPIFSDVCKDAILYGKVNDFSYKTTKVIVTDSNNLQMSVSELELPQVAIIVSPNSSDREIIEAGRIAKTLYKTDERLSYYKPRTDKANRIRTYRDWYWKHLSGLRYVDIASECANSDDPDLIGLDDNRVLKAINYYKKLLTL